MEDKQGLLRAQVSNLSICNRAQEGLFTGWLQTTGSLSSLGCYLGITPSFVQEIEVESLSEQARLLMCLPYSSVAPPPYLGT